VSRLSEKVRQLCELASKEMNPEKLFALVAEIDRLFWEWKQGKQQRFNDAAEVLISARLRS
jgi:hypothetical protein